MKKILHPALLFACLPVLYGADPDPVGNANHSSSPVNAWSELKWARGVENQRKADLGDGTYLNPVMPGRGANRSTSTCTNTLMGKAKCASGTSNIAPCEWNQVPGCT